MSGSGAYADWIAVDWGTTRLRAWAIQDGAPRAEAASDKGMGSLTQDAFEAALLDLIEPWLGGQRMDVIACGMVGSRQGWTEARYASVPCAPLHTEFARPATTDSRLAVHIVPGLKQTTPPDVMRGEETQIAGYRAVRPDFDGVICLPGTHTKWVHISAGEVVSFRTFMTGEMFSLLSAKSVLRHSVGDGWNDEAFANAVSETISRPESLAARLFAIRADHLLNDTDPAAARAALSGLLIGAELAAARPYWLGQEIAIIGAETLADLYETALTAQGATCHKADATQTTLAGLKAAHAQLKEATT